LDVDVITRAVQVVKQVTGPVQGLWSREEDIQHDMYRPYYYDRIAAGLDAQGKPVAWTHRVTGSSIIARVSSELFPKNLRVIRALGLHNVIASLGGRAGWLGDPAAARERARDRPVTRIRRDLRGPGGRCGGVEG